jgi:hypothetical protein
MLSNQLIQFWNDSFADAPMKFRFIVQPALAAYFAIRPGFADAAAGRGLFFWSLFGDPARRRELLREAWTDIGKVFIAAAVVDMIRPVHGGARDPSVAIRAGRRRACGPPVYRFPGSAQPVRPTP